MASWTTGALAAALAVDAPVAAIRCGPTQTDAANPTTPPASIMRGVRRIFITGLEISVSSITAFTAAQQFGLYLQRFSAANMAGGAAALIMKLGSSTFPASVALSGGAEAGDTRVSTTAALTTAGVTLDATSKIPVYGWTTVGPAEYGKADLDFRDNPIRLDLGEGLALCNSVVWPAAGTAVVTATLYFEERILG